MKRILFTTSRLSLLAILTVASADAQAQPKTIRVALAKSFVVGRSKAIIEIASDDFNRVFTAATGYEGQVATKYDAFEIADKLENKQLDFGIFNAHEFAWVQKKHPDLEPILIAANKSHVERAFLIVNKKNAAKTIADLVGKKLDLPVGTNEPCRIFVAKLCREAAKKTTAELFGAVQRSATQSDALDEVARGTVQATVVDTVFLEFYKEIKGAVFAKNLRILQQSDEFPPAVVVCKKGALSSKTFQHFRGGLLKAHLIPQGRDLMKNWNVDAFEAVPKDYAKKLANVLKAYPTP